jgi:hypothetical protein
MVGLETNEIDHHGQGSLAVCAISILNALGQIGKELVAALENAQANERLAAEVVEDLSGQGLGSLRNF